MNEKTKAYLAGLCLGLFAGWILTFMWLTGHNYYESGQAIGQCERANLGQHCKITAIPEDE